MKKEIRSAVNFLKNLLRCRNVNDQNINAFGKKLQELLKQHYQHHWFPEKPQKGSGYRCIRTFGSRVDPLISKAGEAAGLSIYELGHILPQEFTIWIDPAEVSYRIGEEGSICVLFELTAPSTCKKEVADLSSTSYSGAEYLTMYAATMA
ncbi:protein BTG2-like [Glandiceps talaboti]